MKHTRAIAASILTFVILAAVLAATPTLAQSWPESAAGKPTTSGSPPVEILAQRLEKLWRSLRDQYPAEVLLRQALEGASDAGSYQINIALDQTVSQQNPLSFAPQEESAHFEVEGAIGGPDRARFSILPGHTTFALAKRDAQEFLVVDSTVYHRAGDRWGQAESNSPVGAIDGIGLSLLAVARDVVLLDPAEGPTILGDLAPSFRRVGFRLYPEDISRELLAQQGISDPRTVRMVEMSGPVIQGAGELWINGEGLPARLELNLEWVNGGKESYRTRVNSTTDYSGFGQLFPPQHFDPAASPSTGVLIPELVTERRLLSAMWLPAFAALLALGLLLLWAMRGNRRALVALTSILIVALLTPTLAPVVEAAGVGKREDTASESPPATGSEFSRMMRENRELALRHRANAPSPAGAINDLDDEDGDGLPNGYELQLGTNPFYEDSDYDGLTDYEEVTGVPCDWEPLPGQPQTVLIETDPLNPDSNHDGLNDGREIWRGQCGDGHYAFGHLWHDDNDRDGVPDGLDLSPFSASRNSITKLGGSDPGPNLTFETLDQTASAHVVPYPFYVELQVRPSDEESLRWAYKNLQWPGDDKGAIQSTDPFIRSLVKYLTGKTIGTSGKITLIPFLQATLREQDLPSQRAMNQYGVNVSTHKDDNGNAVQENGEALWDLVVPLVPVERGGQVFAFQGKMLHDKGKSDNLIRHWRNLRLKWAVVADVAMPDGDGKYVPSPDGGYGLVVYDEAYSLTGLQVSRQGGASMLVAGALPGDRPYDDGPITLLRAGMEAQFLTGALTMDDIQGRFDTPNNATEEERWGIPQSQRYRVMRDRTMNYQHLDEMLATTTMTTTKQLLDQEFYGREDLKPTLILASEQRTSTVNLDDDPTNDYLDITINTCLKPLITSRSLKLQSYQWTLEGLLGKWQALSLDEVLRNVEKAYATSTDPNYEFYAEELNILKLSTTAWHLGHTSVLKLGQLTIQDLDKVLTNPEMVLYFLDEDGLLPSGYKDVVFKVLEVIKMGGPQAWLEQQWNKIMGYVDQSGEIFDGSFFGVNSEHSPPSSKINVEEMGGGGGGGGEPEAPAEPIDETILGWTDTAITVLNLLATITGEGFFSDVANILTKLVQIYKKIRELVDSVKAIVDSIGKAAESAAQVLTAEVSVLVKPMAVVGLILGVAMIWLGVALQVGDVGPSIALTLVVKAIVDTVLLVVLFVVAAFFPWGTVVAIAIGLIKLFESLVGFNFEPITLLLDWLFSVEAIQRTEPIANQPQLGQLKMEALEPGGGVLSGKGFRLKLPSITTMHTINGGSAGDLNQSLAQLHVGRFANWLQGDPNICTPSEDLFNEYKKALKITGWYEFHAQNYHCIYWKQPREQYWLFAPGGALAAEDPYQVGSGYRRDFLSTAWVDVTPVADINGKFLLDVSLDITIRYDQCSNAGGCDKYTSTSTSPPAISPFYFDILPGRLSGFSGLWNWDELINRDPDADGVWGFISPWSGNPIGPDANICPGKSNTWERWDVDLDGLSDKFELENAGFDPCNNDSDGDGMEDGRELLIGTLPDNPDTDGDGLTDREEDAYDNGFKIVKPWRILLSQRYPDLPDPAAFPNPRQPNIDNDHRNDKQEKKKLTSPNAWNPIPVGEPLALAFRQSLLQGGGTSITVGSASWSNDEAVGLQPSFTMTLPVPFSGVTENATMHPPLPWPVFNHGILQSSTGDAYNWRLPPFLLNRRMQTDLAGLPQIPTEPVTVTAELRYTEGAKNQVSTAAAPLLVNMGGPDTTLFSVQGAVVLGGQAVEQENDGANGDVIITGGAIDSQGVSAVKVCVKTSDTCGEGDWQDAAFFAGLTALNSWTYSFTPADDNIYYVRAYAVDGYAVAGPVSELLTLGVDKTPPVDVRFDLSGTAYFSTTATVDGPPAITLSGYLQDATGAPYVSGADVVGILDGSGRALVSTSVDDPGQPGSAFTYQWTPPLSGYGRSLRTANGVYNLTVGGSDVAGNTAVVSDTLQIVIDDTSPAVYAAPPQTLISPTLSLSGLADDTALLFDRQHVDTFAPDLTLPDRDTQFEVGASLGKVLIVGDVSGDLIDDVVLIYPASVGLAPVPFVAGLFFGATDGFPDTLTMPEADVLFRGELPAARFTWGPDAAGVGDVNGDGVDDLLLGDPSGASGDGRAYLIPGRRGDWPEIMDLADAEWLLSWPRSAGFGGSVAAAGDVNGDGLADFLIGAASNGFQDGGAAWLYLGQEQGAASPHVLFQSPERAGFTPPHLAGLGDSNGDGFSDFLFAGVSEPVALVYGRANNNWPGVITDLRDSADALFDIPGSHQNVANAGDVNGDGLQDMLIGDPDTGQPHVYLIYGRRPENAFPTAPTSLAIDDWADASFVESHFSGARLGAGLTSLGDVDGDKRSDFAFGEPGSGRGPNRTAIVLTRQIDLIPEMPVSAATIFITGTTPSQRSGDYLSAGDSNGDRIIDLMVGASTESQSYLFLDGFDPGGVAGIGRVEFGIFGPVVDSSRPLTDTLPASWQSATLSGSGAAITPWRGDMAVGLNGDYRVYARATDRAGNQSDIKDWYQGNVWVNDTPVPLNGANSTMNDPVLNEQTQLALSGDVNGVQTIQHLRVFDGYRWRRQPPATGPWSQDSTIPRADQSTLTLRAVVRDAFGAALHTSRSLSIDTLVAPPRISADLSPQQWHTDQSLDLVITWPAVLDANGIAGTWAVIDTASDTNPSTAWSRNRIAASLTEPGVYYGHVRVQDGAGNEAISHTGPYLVNRSQTPSVILPDGTLDLAGGEYPSGTLNYDPYARDKPAALYGTWNTDEFFLGYSGHNWGTSSLFSLYMDTQAGGLSNTLNFSNPHTLPFAADFALIVGGSEREDFTLYSADSGAWTAVNSPQSYAVLGLDTEIVLDRGEIQGNGAISLLAFAEDDTGVWAVLPGGARSSIEETLVGSVTFVDQLQWPGLGDGMTPADGQEQVIAPEVVINPQWNNVLYSGQQAEFSIIVKNPDTAPYNDIPITVQTAPEMALLRVEGADCSSCPAGGNQWIVLADVAAGGTQTITMEASTAGLSVDGVVALPISAALVNSGLPSDPQAPARSQYTLDRGMASVSVLSKHDDIFVQPGDFEIGIMPGLDYATLRRCASQVEVNTGSGWHTFCALGDCTLLAGFLGDSSTQTWQIRVTSANGRSSEPVTRLVIADSVAPSVQIATTGVLSGTLAFVRGIAWDDFPTTRAPNKVEVSVDGSRFHPAFLSSAMDESLITAQVVAESSVKWLFPLRLSTQDGDTVQIVARALDEAGNVGPSTESVVLTLDNRGPAITGEQIGQMLAGTASDGSDVAKVELSLDGGAHFQPVALTGESWSFDTADWSGAAPQDFALVRAYDVLGNATALNIPIDPGVIPTPTPGPLLYLPLVQTTNN